MDENSSTTTTGQPARVLVKCGGFSSQLATHIGDKIIDGDPLWGARYDYTNPTAVIQTHLDFLRSGADIILTNTYQSSVEGFMKHLRLNREDSIKLIGKSVQLTKEAKTMHIKEQETVTMRRSTELPLILASIGPFGAHLHDGSEYDGSYTERVTKSQLQNWHRTRIEACLKEGVDGLAVETIPCRPEAEAVVELILNDYPDVKFWVSFQCKDEQHLAHGEEFAEAAASIWRIVKSKNATNRLFGVGVNCLRPIFVSPLFTSLNTLVAPEKIPLVVYSNRGEVYDSTAGNWTGAEKCLPIESYVQEWIELGAVIIGGCCRVYPADIANIRKCVDSIGNNNRNRLSPTGTRD